MVSWERIDDIAFVKMDDGKANAMNAKFLTALMDALEATRSARAVVLSGRSSFFCGGLDLKTLPTLAPAEFQSTINTFERTIRMVLEYPARWWPVPAAMPWPEGRCCCWPVIWPWPRRAATRSA